MATEVSGDELAAVEATIAAMETELTSVQETETKIPTASATRKPSATPTATPVPARIRVSKATNCRSGPDPSFELFGVQTVGQEADVVGESNNGDYWYIVNPDDPESYCWLLSEYASIDGETEGLPVHTPAPTPTPSVGFDVWFHGFASCGDSDLVIFAVRNGGSVRLWSGWLGVYTIENSEPVYGPVKERHPFSKSALETCPPGHGNELYPGDVN